MSGVEEKPIKKEELSLRTFKAFGMTFEEYTTLSAPDRRRERRNRARTGIVIYSICVVANVIAAVLYFIVGNWFIVLHVLAAILFLCWLRDDFDTYIENTELNIGRVHLVRDRGKTD